VPVWPEGGRALGLGRTKTYELVRTGEFPCRLLRLGSSIKVPRVELFRLLGLADDGSNRADVDAGRGTCPRLSADSGQVNAGGLAVGGGRA
jgi:hypothetical protein